MSMSTNVIALRELDGEFERMLRIKHYCEDNFVSYPTEVSNFFGHLVDETENIIRVEMAQIDISTLLIEYNEDMESGFEVDIASLPKGIKTLRFYNSY